MTEAHIDCPLCGTKNALSFYEGTENGAPHGAGFWPMEVSDANQDCECAIPETTWDFARNAAWQGHQMADMQHELNTLIRLVKDYCKTRTPESFMRLDLAVNEEAYDYYAGEPST